MTDPRNHRLVARVDGDRITYRCGCSNRVGHPDGVLRRAGWCAKHRGKAGDPTTLDEAYYRGLGAMDADATARYVAELEAALGPLSPAPAGGTALEIGGGVSPYAAAFLGLGYSYVGVEPSEAAAGLTVRECARRGHEAVRVYPEFFENFVAGRPFDLILAAHSFEHMADAPAMIGRAAYYLRPHGELWIVVPDDSDPINSDHLCFFNEASLRRSVEEAGLEVLRLEARRIVPHELFIYCRAKKGA